MSDKGAPSRSGRSADARLAAVASRQHGVVRAHQLRDLGIDKHAVTHRIRIGRLHRVHRGVYAVGHAKLTFEGRCLAAAFSFGEGAVVSHQSAAAIWGMLRAHDGWIHITIPTRNGRGRRDGLLIHRPPSFGAGFSADGTR